RRAAEGLEIQLPLELRAPRLEFLHLRLVARGLGLFVGGPLLVSRIEPGGKEGEGNAPIVVGADANLRTLGIVTALGAGSQNGHGSNDHASRKEHDYALH